MSTRYWLMKAEPDSRIVKGKDVKFSMDDFEEMKTTPWEGVRNHEAKKLMQSMSVGDKVLFYHSNCKEPGIAGFAEVSKEAHPDHTAWDESHPYFDPKSDKEHPKWFMVELTFTTRATHFVPLWLIKRIAGASASTKEVSYLSAEDVKAISGMALVNRGRLSVQPVGEEAWLAIRTLAGKGGWEISTVKEGRKRSSRSTGSGARDRVGPSDAEATVDKDEPGGVEQDARDEEKEGKRGGRAKARKVDEEPETVDGQEMSKPVVDAAASGERRRSLRKRK